MPDRGLPGAIRTLAVLALAGLLLGAGCLGGPSESGTTSPAAADGSPETQGANATADGNNSSSTPEEPRGANATDDATTGASDRDEDGRWNATLAGDYQAPGYPAPGTVAPTSCEADRNVGGVCFPLNTTARNVTVASVEDDLAGSLPAAYVLFRDANHTVQDAGEADGWLCLPSEPLTIPDWAAFLTVHTGDPASMTMQTDCGSGSPATQGTITVWVRGLRLGGPPPQLAFEDG